MYPATLWLTKASILAFYYELFPFNQKRLRRGLYVTTGFTGICYLAVLYLDAFFCIPIPSNWYTTILKRVNNPQVSGSEYAVYYSYLTDDLHRIRRLKYHLRTSKYVRFFLSLPPDVSSTTFTTT